MSAISFMVRVKSYPIVGKLENVGKRRFLLFPPMLYHQWQGLKLALGNSQNASENKEALERLYRSTGLILAEEVFNNYHSIPAF